MVRVTVRTFGPLASVISGNQVQVELPGMTVEDLLDELVARYGDRMRNFLYPGGGCLSDLLFILVNGKNISHLGGTASTLKEGDIISILPITAGG
jgi:MoaD family protein